MNTNRTDIIQTLQTIPKTLRLPIESSRQGIEVAYYGNRDIYYTAVFFRGNIAICEIDGILDYAIHYADICDSTIEMEEIESLPSPQQD